MTDRRSPLVSPAEPINAIVAPSLMSFDPRVVPVVHGQNVLPAVSDSALTVSAMRQRFAAPPSWTPELRREPQMLDRPPAQAAVLIPVILRASGPTLLLTERASTLSNHSGQVAFPGGRVDPEDANVATAALREAWEEVGLSADGVEVLGTLPTYTTVTAFVVTPVVAVVQPGFALRLSVHEVAAAFEIPLAWLMNPANHRRHALTAPDGLVREWYSMPYHDGPHERFVWGATAGMLRNLYHFLIA